MSNDLRTVHIVINPAAGHGKAPEFIRDHVIPLLDVLSIPYELHTTTAPFDAGQIAQRIYSSLSTPGFLSEDNGASIRNAQTNKGKHDGIPIIIAGGDGTAHEFIEGIVQGDAGSGIEKANWNLILLPLGTANALFASVFPPSSIPSTSSINLFSKLPTPPTDEVIYQLSSLLSYLSGSPPVSLPITETTLLPASASHPAGNHKQSSIASGELSAEVLRSHVVLSTSLHAQILESSEALRKQYPGAERFKMAAMENVTKFFDAAVTLAPISSADGVEGKVGQWDPKTGWREPFTITRPGGETSGEKDLGSWEIKGPFSYFLSTATCDRLEPTFVISPLASLNRGRRASSEISSASLDTAENDSTHNTPEDREQERLKQSTGSGPDSNSTESYIYVTVLRPLRDPLYTSTPDSEKAEVWSKRAFEIIGSAYQGGKHVELTFPLTAPRPGSRTEAASESFAKPEPSGSASPAFELEVKGAGEPVVEVFRVGGFEWTPLLFNDGAEDGSGAKRYSRGNANLVCADGAIHQIPQGGKALVQLLSTVVGDHVGKSGRGGFHVYA